jgi:hypothetical protein
VIESIHFSNERARRPFLFSVSLFSRGEIIGFFVFSLYTTKKLVEIGLDPSL